MQDLSMSAIQPPSYQPLSTHFHPCDARGIGQRFRHAAIFRGREPGAIVIDVAVVGGVNDL